MFCQANEEELTSHARAAKAAEERGDYSSAIREYRSLSRLLPGNAQIRANLGIALYLNGDLSEALAEFQSASKIAPDLFTPHLFSGLAWFRLSEPNRAEGELIRAIRINPSDPVAHLWLGYVYMALSKADLAVEELKSTLAAQPGNIDALYTLGKAYLELGRLETEKLLQLAPDGGRAWQLAAEQCLVRGDQSKALEFYEGAYRRRPDVLEIWQALENLKGSPPAPSGGHVPIAGEDDRFQKAREFQSLSREALEKLGRMAPESYRAHEVMADAFAAQQKNESAIAEYLAVLKLKPDLPTIHQAIGSALFRTGKVAEAIAELEAEVKIQPRSATVHVELARALLVAGKTDTAEKELLAASRLPNPPAAAFKLLGKISLERKNYTEAIVQLERYTQSAPKDSSAHYLLSRAYRSAGNRTAADREIALSRALSIDAKNRTAAQQAMDTQQLTPAKSAIDEQ